MNHSIPRDILILIIEYITYIDHINNLELSCKLLLNLTRANVSKIQSFRTLTLSQLVKYPKLRIVDGAIDLRDLDIEDLRNISQPKDTKHRKLLMQLISCNLGVRSFQQVINWTREKLLGSNQMKWFNISFVDYVNMGIDSYVINLAYENQELRITKRYLSEDYHKNGTLTHNVWYAAIVIDAIRRLDINIIRLGGEYSSNELAIQIILASHPEFEYIYRDYDIKHTTMSKHLLLPMSSS